MRLNTFLAVHSKNSPWSSWSYYEKGENGLIAIEFRPLTLNFWVPQSSVFLEGWGF
jgi:hypothetical protein